jgi:hypothetical protein
VLAWRLHLEELSFGQLVRRKPWARDWYGAPIRFRWALVALLLGAIALSIGLIAGFLLLNWYLEPGKRIEEVGIGIALLIYAVTGGPLIGFAGIAFGAYHLMKRPIFYFPGVSRSTDGNPSGTWKSIFSRSE